jgi:hypothetical protein
MYIYIYNSSNNDVVARLHFLELVLTSAFEVLRTASSASDLEIRRFSGGRICDRIQAKLSDEHAFKVLSWAYGVWKSLSTKAEHLAQVQPAVPGSRDIVYGFTQAASERKEVVFIWKR